MVRQIGSIGIAVVSGDGLSITAPVQFTDGSKMDLAFPVSDLGALVAYFAVLNDRLSEEGVGGLRPPTADICGPIRVNGLGFQASVRPDDTMLVLDLAGCRLGFALTNTRLIALADDVTRVARTLSADQRRPQ
jgi:hypothetical protein